ncbi:helix-turn-helix domain-containing protein [Aeromicrobium sp. CF3.5]|uniref:helix-turn-helix domain-containing protein n=1 Tax=Aeromicrobium sp. CF3.5 TaxID=3373078 RepID=UPI003EE7E511
MSVVGLDERPIPGRVAHARWTVPAESLALLRDRVELAVAGTSDDVSDQLLVSALHEAVQAFLQHDGDPRGAARQVAPWFERIGERQARLGEELPALIQHFQKARQATQRGLRDALGVALVGESLVQLRQSLMAYLDLLLQHAARGMERAHKTQQMSLSACRDHLIDALFDHTDESSLNYLARSVGLADDAYVPVIAIGGPLPAALLNHPDVLRRGSDTEAAVPASWCDEAAVASKNAQVVMGPKVRLGALNEAIGLTRCAARLLSGRTVIDSRSVVPCSDLLALLLVDANPVLVDLLATKHLGPLEAMGESRRAKLGGTLLDWLERGLPANQLARELQLPTQTVHSRLKTCRSIYEGVLDDPVQRLELVIALRAKVPGWRSAAA